MTMLMLAHTEEDGALARPALECLAAALPASRALGASLVIGLAGADTAGAAHGLATCGAARVLTVTGAAFGHPRYSSDAAAAEALGRACAADIIIVPGTSRWMRVAGGVAQRLGGCVDTHVTRLAVGKHALTITRWLYRQRIEGQASRSERPWLIAIEPGTHEPWSGPGDAAGSPAAPIDHVSVDAGEMRTEVLGVRSPGADAQTIRPDAPLLLVAGAGWTKKQQDGQTHVPEAASLILGFLGATQASLGGSKSLVDISGDGQAVLPFMTHLNQVGQTGSSPRHRKGLATCCHGEEPHVVGWRFVSERRAVNLNPNCGWAQGKTDVLYVADAFEVMRNVNARLAGEHA